MANILFNKTFSHIRATIALIRAGDTADEFKILCSSSNPHFAGFLSAHESILEPRNVGGDDYVAYCLGLCRERKVDLFYPGKEAALIAAHAAEFRQQGTQVISVAAPETLHSIHDKGRFYEKYRAAPVPTPEFAVVDDHAGFRRAYDDLRQRHATVCVKPAVSVYGIGFRVIDEGRAALSHILDGIEYHVAAADLLRELEVAGRFRRLLVMEYLNGDEFSVDCLATRGTLRCAILRRKSGGNRYGQRIEYHEEIVSACRELASNEQLNAIFNAQFRIAADGRIKLLEVNPRMSGGTAMSCLAGPNLPYLAVLDAMGQLRDEDIPPVNYGLRVGEVPQAVVFP